MKFFNLESDGGKIAIPLEGKLKRVKTGGYALV